MADAAGLVSVLDLVATVNGAIDTAIVPAEAQFVGDQHLKRNDRPPRVVWVLRKERFEAPDGQARHAGPGNFGPAGKPTVPNGRPLFTRVTGWELHLWGATDKDTESILTVVVRAIYKIAHGCIGPMGGDWTDLAGAGGNTVLGREYILRGDFRIPLTEAPPAVAQVLHQQRVVEASFQGKPAETILDQTE